MKNYLMILFFQDMNKLTGKIHHINVYYAEN